MKLFAFLCVLLAGIQGAAATPPPRPLRAGAHVTTSEMRAAWKAYECAESSMETLMVHESDPKNTALVMVHKKAAKAFRALHGVMEVFGYARSVPLATTGGYACSKNKSSGKFSLHAYGIAADYDWLRNVYGPAADGVMVTTMDDAMIAAVEAIQTTTGEQVFRWGGRYAGHRSPMHFEIIVTPRALDLGISEINLQLRAGFNFGSLLGKARGLFSGGSSGGGSLLQRGLGMLQERGGKLGRVGNILGALTTPGSLTDKITSVAGALGPKGEALGSALSSLTGSGSLTDKIGAVANAAGQLTGNPRINAIGNFVGNAAANGGTMPSLDSVKDLIAGFRGNPGASLPNNGPPGMVPVDTTTGNTNPADPGNTNAGNTNAGNLAPFIPVNSANPNTAPVGVNGSPSSATNPLPGTTVTSSGGKITGVIPARVIPARVLTCSSFQCPVNTAYKFGMNIHDPQQAGCGTACDQIKCCSAKQTCGQIRCGAGTEHRNRAAMCATSVCSQSECCVALPAKSCVGFVCNAATHHLVLDAAMLDCPLGACAASLCCGKSGQCGDVVCENNTTPKLSPPAACKGAKCAPTECCDAAPTTTTTATTTTATTTTATTTTGKCVAVQCGAMRPRKPNAASLPCATAACTLDECCGAAFADGTGKVRQNPNFRRPHPNFDKTTFGGKDGRLPATAAERPFEDTEVNAQLVAAVATTTTTTTTTDAAAKPGVAVVDDGTKFGKAGARTPAQRAAFRAQTAADLKANGKAGAGSADDDAGTAQILMIVGIVIGAICLLIGFAFAVVVVQRKAASPLHGAQQQSYYRQDAASPIGGGGGGQQQSRMQQLPASSQAELSSTHVNGTGGSRISSDAFEAGLPSSLKNYNRNPASISIAMAGGLDNNDFYRQGRLYSDVSDGFRGAAPVNRGV